MSDDDIVVQARNALATRRAQESVFYPRALVEGLVTEVERLRQLGTPIASSGGRTQLNRVIDLVNKGHTPASIKSWCAKHLNRLT